jgi:hypothetical protein
MQNRYNALPRWDEGPPAWQPQPGEVLAGVIDRYTISDTPPGPGPDGDCDRGADGRAGQPAARLDVLAVVVRAVSAPPRRTD